VYLPAANSVAISSNAAERIRIGSTGTVNIVGAGTAGVTQAVSFNGSAPVNSLVIDSSGRCLIGTSTSRSVGDDGESPLQISGTGFGGLSIVNNRNDTSAGVISIAKNRSGSVGESTVVENGDFLGAISFAGADGNDLETQAAFIGCQVDGPPDANDMPGRLVFSTTAAGASSPTERLRITSAGVLQIADAGNIAVGTTTGTKIGTATTQKLGFYNATPVVQPTAVADATDAASVITQLNALLTRMRNLGLIAT
jgi:hypothetical protein